jgi:GT2 family glycosyltransferase
VSAPTVSVVVPSYRRPDQLRLCLLALARQRLAPLETLVVLRPDDHESRDVASAAEGVSIVSTVRPGMVAALNAGREVARGELIAFTDDDGEAHPDWLERLVERFESDARIGAVGGRDIVYRGDRVDEGVTDVVGRLRWYGRRIGRHHFRSTLQDVQIVKGANMAYRAIALEPFDVNLRGGGAEVHNDLEASLSVWRRGWRVVYDPSVLIDHRPGPRFDDDGRERRSLEAELAETHNELYALLRHSPPARRPLVLAYQTLVGTRLAPGLAFGAVQALRGKPQAWPRTFAFARARAEALGTLLRAGSPRGATPSTDTRPGGR